MQIPTIEMASDEARILYREYAEAVRIGGHEDDEILKQGYQALSEGRRLINLNDVMREAGVDERGRPRLAICRAHVKHCYCRREIVNRPFQRGKYVVTFATCERALSDGRMKSSRVEVPSDFLQGVQTPWRALKAVVPSVPPRYRPVRQTRRGKKYDDLRNYHILWEAEWEEVPVDPLLLKHLTGPLYVVLAEWDLTELEQAMLGKYL